MMYLSQLILNPACRLMQRDLARPYEMHRTLLNAFPDGKVRVERKNEEAIDMLFRAEIDGDVINVLVQSKTAPDWSCLNEIRDDSGRPYLLPADRIRDDKPNPRTIIFDLTDKQLPAGRILSFRLRANPTKRLSAGKGNTGKRVGIYDEEDQLAWLARKGERHGFRVLQAQVSHDGKIVNEKAIERDDKEHKLELLSVQFDGVLQVTDPDKLVAAVETGIGSGKGFGFGLLSLAPAPT